jgi:integrase
LGAPEVGQFLTHLAVNGRVSASTQNQARCALLFLYKEVLAVELPWLDNVEQAKAPKRLPVVLNREEIQGILSRLNGTNWLIASLLYGTGMRIMECLRLRVKDVDMKRKEILIRDGKGFKDRVTMLPVSLVRPLEAHLQKVREWHQPIWRKGTVRCICRMRWSESIPMRRRNEAGSMCFRPPNCRPIPGAAKFAAITFRNRRSSGR